LASIFIHNQIYKRSQIHDQYGGGRQGGISASAQFPYIFIFSSESGEQHGYKDGWENPYVYSYSGEGQVGDMRFIKGNLALKDHIKNGKRVFLFIYVRKAFVRFEAELEVIDFDYFPGFDKNGNSREAIKFFLKRKGAHIDYSANRIELPPILEEENKSNYIDTPNETERKGLVISRVGQGAYRKSILYRWDFKCAVTSYGKFLLHHTLFLGKMQLIVKDWMLLMEYYYRQFMMRYLIGI
jgi:5-methylcytosine-specific restriction enzyme A